MAKATWWLLRQFCGTRKILVGFAAFSNSFFISESTVHTVVFFYFKFHFFFERECGYRSSSTESSPNLCGKKSVLKRKKKETTKQKKNKERSFHFAVGKEIIVSSKGENAGESVGGPWRAWEVMPVVSGCSDSPREAEETCVPSLSVPRAGALPAPWMASQGAADWEEGHVPQSLPSHRSWGPSLHQAGHTCPDQDADLRTNTLLLGWCVRARSAADGDSASRVHAG